MSDLVTRAKELEAAIGANWRTDWTRSGACAHIETATHDGQVLLDDDGFSFELYRKADLRTIKSGRNVTAGYAVLEIAAFLG